MSTTDAVLNYLQNLTQHGFWGFVTVKFENGCPVHLRREENLKPSELHKQLPEKNRTNENDTDNKH